MTVKEERFMPSEVQIRKICELLAKGCSVLATCESVFGEADKMLRSTHHNRMVLVRNIKNGHSYSRIFSEYIGAGAAKEKDDSPSSQLGIFHKRLCADEVIRICELIQCGFTNCEIARIMYGADNPDKGFMHSRQVTISDIRNRKYHSRISKRYKFPEIGERVDSDIEIYYPSNTTRYGENIEIETLCRLVIDNKIPQFCEMIRIIYARNNLKISDKNILQKAWRIRNGMLYGDFYKKCLEEVQHE